MPNQHVTKFDFVVKGRKGIRLSGRDQQCNYDSSLETFVELLNLAFGESIYLILPTKDYHEIQAVVRRIEKRFNAAGYEVENRIIHGDYGPGIMITQKGSPVTP